MQIAKCKSAFPKVPPDFFEVLKNRFKENGFTDQRIIDSVNNVIDNYVGWDKFPNIANFIQFDKTNKNYTYRELLDMSREMSPPERGEFLNKYECINPENGIWAKK